MPYDKPSCADTPVHAFERSRAAVEDAQKRVHDVREQATKVRDALRGTQSEHRAILARNLEELTVLQHATSVAAPARAEHFGAIVSHELRQPLNAAMAAAQLLETGQAAERAHTVLRRQLLQMSELLDTLLDMSRISMKTIDLDLRRLDVALVIDRALETVEAAARVKDLDVSVSGCPADLCVFADERRLRQVFANLLSNAIRYTPRGGRIRVAAEGDDRVVVIDVRDSGRGIPADELTTIFEPFARGTGSGGEGLGVGLALVRGLVDLHGGTVEVASDGPGRGSCFTVKLPRFPAAFAPDRGSSRTRSE